MKELTGGKNLKKDYIKFIIDKFKIFINFFITIKSIPSSDKGNMEKINFFLKIEAFY